jgi:hypothetical protein
VWTEDDVVRIRQEHQYDNGAPAGAPPVFDPPMAEPLPRRESTPVTVFVPPRAGGDPILQSEPVRAGTGAYAPRVPEDGPEVAPVTVRPSTPVLRAATGTLQAAPSWSATGTATRVDWPAVVLGSLALVLILFFLGDDDS